MKGNRLKQELQARAAEGLPPQLFGDDIDQVKAELAIIQKAGAKNAAVASRVCIVAEAERVIAQLQAEEKQGDELDALAPDLPPWVRNMIRSRRRADDHQVSFS